jgi:hypothetical protein
MRQRLGCIVVPMRRPAPGRASSQAFSNTVLADITNTTAIRAVVANGRYFDRGALDSLLTEVQTKAKGSP